MDSTIDKVSAFLTRERAGGRALLVFRHDNPAAGVQVPAGTVDPGEAPAQAVAREVWEETGLVGVRITGVLGRLVEDLSLGRCALLGATPLRRAPDPVAPLCPLGLGWAPVLGRAWYVDLVQRGDEWAEVVFEQADPASDPPYQPIYTRGWLPAALLTTRLARTLYHAVAPEPTPDAWTHFAEGRYYFHYTWVPLTPRPHLSDWQDRWLDAVYDQLVARDLPD